MSKCVVCGHDTDVVVNIRFAKVLVCDVCCLSITKQTVDSLTVTTWRSKDDGKETTEISSRKD